MIDTQLLGSIVNKVSSLNKKLLQRKEVVECKEFMHSNYLDAVEMAEHISYHAVKDKFPEKLFKHRSPNETELEAKYIRNNYRQYTLPTFVDYISTITRPFADNNWSIEYKEDKAVFKTANKTFQEYVEKDLPLFRSLENFVKFVLPSIKTIDANGYLGVRPKNVSMVENSDGDIVVNSLELLEPTVFYYSSDKVIEVTDEYALFISNEKSEVSFANRVVKEGLIVELYTEYAIYFIKQVGNKVDNRFEVVEFLTYEFDYLPVIQLKGIPNIKNDEVLWQSPLVYAVDLLDNVAMNANWLQASINSCVYPVKVMYGQPCEFQTRDENGVYNCTDGFIINGLGEKTTCPSCNGSGLKNRLSPLGTLLLNPKGMTADGDTAFSQKPLEYVSPSTETLEFINKKIDLDLQKARQILHIHTSNSDIKGSEQQTATGMVLDNKAMYAFVKPISDQIFDIYEFLLSTIGYMRYGNDFEPPSLNYPKSFDFKTSEDYLIDISNAQKANLPPSFVSVVLMQYINAFYGDNNITTQVFKLIMSADRLFGLSADEINMQLARGTVAKWEQVLHTSATLFVNELISEDSEFLNKEASVQITKLQDKAKAVQAANTPTNDLINSLAQ